MLHERIRYPYIYQLLLLRPLLPLASALQFLVAGLRKQNRREREFRKVEPFNKATEILRTLLDFWLQLGFGKVRQGLDRLARSQFVLPYLLQLLEDCFVHTLVEKRVSHSRYYIFYDSAVEFRLLMKDERRQRF